ncbi:MAG: hypothetical protein IMY71_00660 [Bacteroidetes bacterium]|nr:hypothetical protein [Bacteroidota bacterium]
MTLITHIRNKKIVVIAGDSQHTHTDFNGHETTFLVQIQRRKVYNFKDCILGIYGGASNAFVVWLESLDETKRLNTTLDSVKNKCNEIIKDHYDNYDVYSLVIGTYKKSIIAIYPKSYFIELNTKNSNIDYADEEIEYIRTKDVFFSPQGSKQQIDKLEKTFNELFMEIYASPFDIEKLDNDRNLDKLLKRFYQVIESNPELNNGLIDGNVKYHILDLRNFSISNLSE